MLADHLPKRYEVSTAQVIDAYGGISEQIDLVLFDRQYTPKLFNRDGALFLPAESVYAAIEIKQDLGKAHLHYASKKIASVRRLRRTSVAIAHAGGRHRAVRPKPIIGALLCLESSWDPPLGQPLRRALASLTAAGRIDLGCAVQDGAFTFVKGGLRSSPPNLALVSFFVWLFDRLQRIGTVPALDLSAYARHGLPSRSSSEPRPKTAPLRSRRRSR